MARDGEGGGEDCLRVERVVLEMRVEGNASLFASSKFQEPTPLARRRTEESRPSDFQSCAQMEFEEKE